MGLSVLAAYFVASQDKRRRAVGFWVFVGSNVLWTIWACPKHAYALVVLQIALLALNIRGLAKNQPR